MKDRKIKNLKYADNMVVLFKKSQSWKKYDIEINIKNSKVMSIRKRDQSLKISIGNERLRTFRTSTAWAAILPGTNTTKEIARITNAKAAIREKVDAT